MNSTAFPLPRREVASSAGEGSQVSNTETLTLPSPRGRGCSTSIHFHALAGDARTNNRCSISSLMEEGCSEATSDPTCCGAKLFVTLRSLTGRHAVC